MKKSLFGYRISDVTIAMSAIREENESLNATITSLKTHIKNIESGNNAKSILLENDIKAYENKLKEANEEKEKLSVQMDALKNEMDAIKQQNQMLASQLEQSNKEKEELNRQINSLNQYITEILTNNSEFTDKHQKLQARMDELLGEKIDVNETYEKSLKELEAAKEEAAAVRNDLTDRTYYDMPKLQKEAMDYLYTTIKDYYQIDDENSAKIRETMEQCQAEYNQLISEFNYKVSEFRSILTKMNNDLCEISNYQFNIEKLNIQMKEMINKLIEEGNDTLQNKEELHDTATKDTHAEA